MKAKERQDKQFKWGKSPTSRGKGASRAPFTEAINFNNSVGAQ